MDDIKIPETYEEDPSFWEKQAQRKIIRFLHWTILNQHCFMCKWTIEGGLLNKNPKQVVHPFQMFKGEYLYHIKSSHGIEPEIFLEMLNG